MNKVYAISLGTTILLAACSPLSVLHLESDAGVITGKITRHIFEPDQIEIGWAGKTFQGELHENPLPPAQLAQISYPHRRRWGQSQITLTAQDGSTLACSFKTHDLTGEGVCSDAHTSFPLKIRKQ